ncbi:MAG: ACT domain-containing protein [Candidatus Faecousia sp.]|jgi:chorismate mutase|uniref:ACT domain-containing protein n=1 Tax=Faecousia sp. TaxID=2952921 RepID=UPI002A89B5B1|nr:ACT domain-containing protein [Candidatus Faecousia sp.]
MDKMPKYFIVEARALPEVFRKVAEAKWLLENGEVATVGEATKATDISRSAFYKYRDSIAPFENLMAGRILTFQLILRDVSGLLSAILSVFAQYGANILTINQTIPSNGTASVTVSAETNGVSEGVEALLRALAAMQGVLKAEILAG